MTNHGSTKREPQNLFSFILQMTKSEPKLTQQPKCLLHNSSLTIASGVLCISDAKNVTHLLDNLLLGYDNHLRPGFGGPPLEVNIDLYVRSMAFVSEIDMIYSMDCYFRQTWKDTRLAFRGFNKGRFNLSETPSALALSITMLEKIWKPDTYFYNGKNAYMHTITVPNKFVRIYEDGRILYSSRMTIKATCPMSLENFPMDTQVCPLEMGSFGYSTDNIIYKWNPDRKIVIAKDMKMSQFALKSTPFGNDTGYFRKGGPYSKLCVAFHFQRYMGHFVIEVYVPCIMLVVLSWVSFWINREATADRIGLGITTVLTMTFLGLESRNDLPKVPYCTALDYFVATSFAFIFATIVEFAIVHYFTKVGSGEYYFSPSAFLQMEEDAKDSDADDEDEVRRENEDNPRPVFTISRFSKRQDLPSFTPVPSTSKANFGTETETAMIREERQEKNTYTQEMEKKEQHEDFVQNNHGLEMVKEHDSDSNYIDFTKSYIDLRVPSLTSSIGSQTSSGQQRRDHGGSGSKPISRISSLRASINRGLKRTFSRRKNMKKETVSFQLNSVSQIDRISRVVFPLAFIIINFIYWMTYLSNKQK